MIYDIMTYHAIMIAKPVRPNIASKGIQVSRKMYFTWLPFQPHSLNLSANIGISETISQELIRMPPKRKNTINGVASNHFPAPIMSEPQKRALAGVGNPINPSACRSSRLNFANRNAENAAIIYAVKGVWGVAVQV